MKKNQYYDVNKEVRELFNRAKKRSVISPSDSSYVNKSDLISHNSAMYGENQTENSAAVIIIDECSSESSESPFSSIASDITEQIENICIQNIASDIAEWSVENNISNQAGNSLLKILRKYHPNLPKDIRTLKKTESSSSAIVQMGHGIYSHIGVTKNLQNFLKVNSISNQEISIDIGINGVPLAKSSNSQLWPILGTVVPYNYVFIIGIFHGHKKPFCADVFLTSFVEEMKILLDNGIQHNDQKYTLKLRSFICDAPARSFVLGMLYLNYFYLTSIDNIFFFFRLKVSKVMQDTTAALNVSSKVYTGKIAYVFRESIIHLEQTTISKKKYKKSITFGSM